MIKNLIITGAGFSKEYGLPLDRELMSTINQNLGTKYGELIPFLEKAGQEYLEINNLFERSIEEILTRIQYIDLFDPIIGNDLNWREFRIELLNLLSEILKIENPPDSFYFEFVRLFSKDTVFVTLNYDLLIENLFRLLNCNYTYLFGEHVLRFIEKLEYHQNYSISDFLKSSNDPHFPIVYLKLHGSFNWHICWRCHKIYLKDAKSYGVNNLGSRHNPYTQQSQCTECQHEKGLGNPVLLPLVIPPTLIKYYEFKFIKHLWALYYHLVTKVENIFMIGTSLRNEDLLLINSINYLSMRNSHLKEFVLINPSNEVATRTKNLVNFKISPFKSIQDFLINK